MTQFTHLHNHSEYSLLDGMTKPEEMAKITADNGQTSVALSDHGTMSGILRFQEAGKTYGVNTILGIEAYFVPSISEDRADEKKERYHLILHAKNDEGLKKLFQVTRKSWQRPNFYKKPRIEMSDLEYLAPDVICLSGCMGSWLSQTILDDEDGALMIADSFKTIFGDDYYLELQPWNAEKLNTTLLDISKVMDIPIVGTLDCHYPTKEDRGVEETLLMMGQVTGLNAANKRYAKQHADEAKDIHDLVDKMNCMYPERFLRFENTAVYLQNNGEVYESFKAVGLPLNELFDNTMVIADKCSAKLETKRSLLPKFSKNLDSADYLKDLAYLGLEEKGFDKDQTYIDRLEEELSTVISLGFADYFLVVWDIVSWAKGQSIPVGPGRGSVGGSLLAYTLGITKIDPIHHGLLFSRFLNKERVSWPDIDLDFGDRYREQVKTYIKDHWGRENVASIATFIDFKPKGTVKQLATVFGVPYQEANALSPLFETFDELKKSDRGAKFLKEYPETLPVAERLDGRIKGTGVHPAGVVVSSLPLWQVCPVESRAEKAGDERVEVVAFDMDQAETIGLLKFDILGVKALCVIDDCIKKIKENYDLDVTEISERLDDSVVYRDISSGYTVGVFQVEATAYRNLILEMGIESFYDLSASNALVRPGAFITQGDQYLAVKNGEKKMDPPHAILEEDLRETFGTIVYQEQLMKVAEKLAGFTQYESDTLRKIIGKKRDSAEFEPFHEKFIEGSQKYVTKEKAEQLWEDLEKTATYMFNKSHAVGYSMLSYQMAWLKHYYPTEFIWALLSNEDQSEQFATYLMEANRLGVQIEGPDVNISNESFTLADGRVRFGLKNVANCGPSAISEILKQRPFSSLAEMKNKCRKTAVKSNLYDNLEKLGAFASMGEVCQYDSKKYWLKLLNCAIYADSDFLKDVITPLGQVDPESETLHLVRGVVKSTKRKPNYFRVEMEDTTGSQSFFCSMNAGIKNREYLLALVGDKRMHMYADATMADDDFDDPFIQLLRQMDGPFIIPPELKENGIGSLENEVSIIRLLDHRYFKTKAGKIMANAYLYEPSLKEFKKAVVFADVYGRTTKYFVQGNWSIIKHSLSKKDGGLVIDDIIDLPSYCELKGISVENVTDQLDKKTIHILKEENA
jgi:DNA polymerase-3 subunit alpha